MTRLDFKRTTRNLGALGHAYVSVGYRKADGTDVWEAVPIPVDRGQHELPDGTRAFVVQCQILGPTGGGVELEVKNGERILKPSFSRDIQPAEAGQTFPAYRVYTL